jgi:tRNA(His) 5'-end guanylyltransferase
MRGFRRVARCVLPGWQALVDHPGFGFEKPFDARFGKAMVKAVSHVVGSDPGVAFGYVEHGEFSILLGSAGDDGQGDGRALLCQLASQAAGRLSLLLGDLAPFDVHLFQFPSPELARAYFVWRQACHRSVLVERYVRHLLSRDRDESEALAIMEDLGDEEKQEILAQNQVDLEILPPWQVRGAAVFWQVGVEDDGATLMIDTLLPAGKEYGEYLRTFL